MKLTTYNAVLLAVILTGTLLLGIFAVISFAWVSIQDISPRNVVVAAPENTQNAEEEPVVLNLVFDDDKYGTRPKLIMGPRVYMEQGRDSYKSKGSLSGFGYQHASKRNIGHVALDTLETQWYFETNNQNILDIDDIFTKEDSETKWHGTFVEIVNSDTNADGILSSKDLSKLYWVDATFKPRIILEDLQSVNRLVNYENDSLLKYRRDGKDLISKFDLETNEITLTNLLKPQK